MPRAGDAGPDPFNLSLNTCRATLPSVRRSAVRIAVKETDETSKKVLVASPRGFCAGVSYAIDIVDRVLDQFGPPVFVRHEIVHNRHVVDRLKARGAKFVEDLSSVPQGSLLIFSAHGVSPSVRDTAVRQGLRVVDGLAALLRDGGVAEMRVATLGDGVDYEPYARTRAFYRGVGFTDFERRTLDNPECPEQLILSMTL